MTDAPIHRHADEVPWEHDPDDEGRPARIRTRTLVSADRTPTRGLSVGTFELPPGAYDALHRHAPPEVYYVLDGEAEVHVADAWRPLVAGDVVYVPADTVHGTRNRGEAPCTIMLIFPVDSYGDVEYRFD